MSEAGPAAKMVNLTLKHLVLLDRLTTDERRALHEKLHVALDRFTLGPIAALAPQMSPHSVARRYSPAAGRRKDRRKAPLRKGLKPKGRG